MTSMNSDSENDSPSPYPPSTPTIDSDDEQQPKSLASPALRASIATLPEYRLRDIVLRLADSSHYIRRALQKEITFLEDIDTPPTTPTAVRRQPKSKRSSRPHKSHSCRRKQGKSGSRELKSEAPDPEDNATRGNCVYHPGQLEDEVYDFVSRTPNGAAFKVAQTVTMWSCCNEDEWSPGCISIASTFGRSADKSVLTLDTRALAHGDVYPDAEVESTPMHGHTV